MCNFVDSGDSSDQMKRKKARNVKGEFHMVDGTLISGPVLSIQAQKRSNNLPVDNPNDFYASEGGYIAIKVTQRTLKQQKVKKKKKR